MIEYKSQLNNGFGVIFVKPNGTSSKCTICGSKMIPKEHRMMRCQTCQTITDRDVDASKNILARGLAILEQTEPVRFEPDVAQDEAMKQLKDVE
jgi:putative transposase